MIWIYKKFLFFVILFWLIGSLLTFFLYIVFPSLFEIKINDISGDYRVSIRPGEPLNLYLCSRNGYPIIDDYDFIYFIPEDEALFSFGKISVRLKLGDSNPIFCEGIYRIESMVEQVVELSLNMDGSDDYFIGWSSPLTKPIISVLLLIAVALSLSLIVYGFTAQKIFKSEKNEMVKR